MYNTSFIKCVINKLCPNEEHLVDISINLGVLLYWLLIYCCIYTKNNIDIHE